MKSNCHIKLAINTINYYNSLNYFSYIRNPTINTNS